MQPEHMTTKEEQGYRNPAYIYVSVSCNHLSLSMLVLVLQQNVLLMLLKLVVFGYCSCYGSFPSFCIMLLIKQFMKRYPVAVIVFYLLFVLYMYSVNNMF